MTTRLKVSLKEQDYFNSFRQYLSKVTSVDDAEWDNIVPLLSLRSFKKEELILRPGEISDQMLFLVEGIARSYFIDESGREFNWSFNLNIPEAKSTNVFIVDYASFVSGSPSRLHIECLFNLTTISITKENLQNLYTKSHFWSEIGRRIAEQVYFLGHNRSLNQLALDAKERYTQFIKTYPYLLDHLSQNQIAAFLGITPQSLSRLKKSIN